MLVFLIPGECGGATSFWLATSMAQAKQQVVVAAWLVCPIARSRALRVHRAIPEDQARSWKSGEWGCECDPSRFLLSGGELPPDEVHAFLDPGFLVAWGHY